MMKRREFITLLGGAAVACDLAPCHGAASCGGIQHASDAFTMVAREIVCVRPAAVALVEHRAPDVVGILRTSARTHPCSADVGEGNLRSLRHSVSDSTCSAATWPRACARRGAGEALASLRRCIGEIDGSVARAP
jgi:hypothetical protein